MVRAGNPKEQSDLAVLLGVEARRLTSLRLSCGRARRTASEPSLHCPTASCMNVHNPPQAHNHNDFLATRTSPSAPNAC